MKAKPNRQRAVRILALTLAGLMILATLVAALFPLYAEEALDEYAMNIHIADGYPGAMVQASVVYTNRTGTTQDDMYFALGANAYRRYATSPVEYDAMNDAYPDGFAPGGVELYSVTVNGESADFGLRGEGEEFLRVRADLAPGESATFAFLYELVLPQARTETGGDANDIRLIDFYPRALVYDSLLEEYVEIRRTSTRDSVYAEMANYKVVVEAPSRFALTAPGTMTSEKMDGGYTRYAIDAPNVRDFSAVLRDNCLSYETTSASGTKIRLLTGNRLTSGQVLDSTKSILDTYTAWFGGCPREDITILESNVLAPVVLDGMIILPESALSFSARNELERTLAFFLAKCWFGIGVESHPELEPWLDDAISSYVSMLYTEEAHGYPAFRDAMNSYVTDALQVTLPGSLWVDSAASYFTSRQEYETIIMRRGTAAMHELRDIMSREDFLEALKIYYTQNAFQIASIANFAAAINAASGHELDLFLMDQLRNIGDYVNQQMDRYID